MWTVFRRALLPIALVAAGAIAIVEGVWFHPIPVIVEKETKKTIDVTPPAPPGTPMDGPSSDGPSASPGMPFGRQNVVKRTVTEIEIEPLIISEPAATRDVTVGGLERVASGEHAGKLRRTYSGEKGPALCPT